MSHIHRALPMVHIPGNRTPARPLFLSLGPPSPPLVPEPPARPRTESTLVFRAGTGDVSYSLQLHGEAPPGRVTFVHAPQHAGRRSHPRPAPTASSVLQTRCPCPVPSRHGPARSHRPISHSQLRVKHPGGAAHKVPDRNRSGGTSPLPRCTHARLRYGTGCCAVTVYYAGASPYARLAFSQRLRRLMLWVPWSES
ncbi:hypothetical protein VTO73DRAFT_7181 [Trametes versicolor]